jgi:hypothetical protein
MRVNHITGSRIIRHGSGLPGPLKAVDTRVLALVRRAVLSADPAAARRRKEAALQDARVEAFPEHAGTAGLAGRDLCPVDVLAADKHLTALAQAMKAAGITGTLDVLRAHAYLHLLSGQPASTLLHPAPPTPTPTIRRHGTRQHRTRQRAARHRLPLARSGSGRPPWAARLGQPDHAPVGLARLDPVPRRHPRLRPHRRRRLPHPGRPAGPQPRQPMVRHPHRPGGSPCHPRLRSPRTPATTRTGQPRHSRQPPGHRTPGHRTPATGPRPPDRQAPGRRTGCVA